MTERLSRASAEREAAIEKRREALFSDADVTLTKKVEAAVVAATSAAEGVADALETLRACRD